MRLYLVLVGATRHDAALLQPCGSYQFLWDSKVELHVLDGGPLTMERFNEASEDLARRWPHEGSRFRWAPMIRDYEETPHENALAEQLRAAEEHAGQMARDFDAKLESKEAVITELRAALAARPRKLVPAHPAAEPPTQA